MDAIFYLSISTAVLFIAFLILLIVSNLNANQKPKQKKPQLYNASVLRKHITKELDD